MDKLAFKESEMTLGGIFVKPDKELKELLEKYIKKSDRLQMNNVYEVKVLEINQELKNREELRKGLKIHVKAHM
jgi:hypothetical protein